MRLFDLHLNEMEVSSKFMNCKKFLILQSSPDNNGVDFSSDSLMLESASQVGMPCRKKKKNHAGNGYSMQEIQSNKWAKIGINEKRNYSLEESSL